MNMSEGYGYRDLSKVWSFYIKKYMDKGCSELKARCIAVKVMKRKGIL